MKKLLDEKGKDGIVSVDEKSKGEKERKHIDRKRRKR